MLAIAILAAGKGTRMKSSLPKVLQELSGTTLLERVLQSCKELDPDRSFVIIGHEAQQIKTKISQMSEIEFVLQSPQKGTGHAVQQLIPLLKNFEGELLVLNGDVPLLDPITRPSVSTTTGTSAKILSLLGSEKPASITSGHPSPSLSKS